MRKADPVARALEAYRAVPAELRAAADYLLRAEMRGQNLVVPKPKVGRPAGSKNKQQSAPLIDGAIYLPGVNAAKAENL